MSLVELRYLASREWMESELLSGNPIHNREQRLSIELAHLDLDLGERVEAVVDAAFTFRIGKKQFVCVLDSGIDPSLSFGPDEKNLRPLDRQVTERVGALPELPKPTEDVAAVVEAWEHWLEEYQERALVVIEGLNKNPPQLVQSKNRLVKDRRWGSVQIFLGEGLMGTIATEDGAKAIRDALAGGLWDWAAREQFSSESYAAAREATDVDPAVGRGWLDVMPPEKLAEFYLHRKKQLFKAVKAHHVASRAKAPDFDTEMRRWADERGSYRLRLGLQDGYRMNSRYLAERLAAEAPGMYAMPVAATQDDWAHKAGSPSEAALRLRRRIAAAMKQSAPPNLDGKPEPEIVIVKKPPHELYLADPGIETGEGHIGKGLPRRDGWPWRIRLGQPVGESPVPFEAVVVKNWLGKYHLIGAVSDDFGSGPPGVWAVPDPDHFGEDGKVQAQDPDALAPDAARRKPPEESKEDDIPF
jgi:hypothetical protein